VTRDKGLRCTAVRHNVSSSDSLVLRFFPATSHSSLATALKCFRYWKASCTRKRSMQGRKLRLADGWRKSSLGPPTARRPSHGFPGQRLWERALRCAAFFPCCAALSAVPQCRGWAICVGKLVIPPQPYLKMPSQNRGWWGRGGRGEGARLLQKGFCAGEAR